MNIYEDNQTIEYPPVEYVQIKAKKKRPFVKATLLTMGAVTMMVGSGVMGAHIATNNIMATLEQVQPVVISEAPAPSVIELLSASINNRNAGSSLPQLFEYANPAVVAISTETTGRNVFGQVVTRPSAGSGFIVSADGYIVTNDHVIENASTINVIMYDGTQVPATVVGRAPHSDIAVIKIEQTGLPYLGFGNSDTLQVGEQVAAIGNPLGEFANSMTVGYISALDRSINIDGMSRNKLQTDAAVNRGNSGGPLINARGQVIGIVSAKSTGSGVEGIGFAIPSTYASEVVSDLITYGHVRGRAMLGITITDVNDYVEIVNVSTGSAAYNADIRVGDVIIAIDGTTVDSFADLRRHLDNADPGDEMRVMVRRGEQIIEKVAVLDEQVPFN